VRGTGGGSEPGAAGFTGEMTGDRAAAAPAVPPGDTSSDGGDADADDACDRSVTDDAAPLDGLPRSSYSASGHRT
jgi:hypothetical protein